MKQYISIKYVVLCFVSLLLSLTAYAQDVANDFETRTSVKLSFKPIKKLKISVSPELRFNESFDLSKSLIEGRAQYKTFDFLYLQANYRFIANYRETKDTEYLSRYSFGAVAKKEFNRFETAFRLRYSNHADEDDEKSSNFFRYKLSLKYDIHNSKITPFVAAEVFHDLDASAFYKMRYSLGADYKLFKNNYLSASYKFDYYNQEYRNKHIVSIGYKIKF